MERGESKVEVEVMGVMKEVMGGMRVRLDDG